MAERPLAIFEGQRVSYREVRARAWSIGSALQRLGASGERVVTMLPNNPELLSIQLAVLHAGGVVVPVIEEGTPEEMRYFVDDAEASIVFATRLRWESIAPVLRTIPRIVVLTDAEGPIVGGQGATVHSLAELEAQGADLGLDPVHVPNTDPMALMYTSGSTARPKGVIVDAASFIRAAEIQPDFLGLREGENVLGVLQLFHIGGWHQSLAVALGCRGGLMMQRRFSASRFWQDVDAAPAVGGLLVPAMVSILLACPERDDDADHPLRVVYTHWGVDAFEQRFGVEIVPLWGQTESAGLITSGVAGGREQLSRYVGRPAPGVQLDIRDIAGRAVPIGKTGEICVRSPWLMKGYWRDPPLTAKTLKDGWLHTGDLGHLDEDGRLFFDSRLKTMIKRAGENISAVEVEVAIVAHPDITECVCFSVPDPIRTEEVKAVLVLRPGAAVDFSALVGFCRERLAEFKIPRYWEVRPEMPRTRSLKVALPALRAEHLVHAGWDRTLAAEGETHAADARKARSG